MSNPLNRLEGFKLDVLKEVGNIGAGNAATALSRLLDKPVDMKVPSVNIMPFEQIADKVGGFEQVVAAIYMRVEGEAPGNMFFLIQQEAVKKLLGSLLAADAGERIPYTEMENSALAEIGNILGGSYLSSLADFTRLAMLPTVPATAVDMAGAILSYGLVQSGEMGDSALLIDTTFLEGRESFAGHFFFIPDPESFDTIFNALGVASE
ncbi:chemotaxis protein CheC [Paenibacillus sp. GCM10027626]|uniref:chemotaxis protein CheC n=1 Tax=Paenibacillus sp. GCM10027626 TaxID=3273411 RepID=UPI003634D133